MLKNLIIFFAVFSSQVESFKQVTGVASKSCDKNSECTSKGYVCNFLFPSNGKEGTCQPVCGNNNSCSDPTYSQCNPNTNICEVPCQVIATGANDSCRTRAHVQEEGQGERQDWFAQCSTASAPGSQGYCQLPCKISGTQCPTGFTCSTPSNPSQGTCQYKTETACSASSFCDDGKKNGQPGYCDLKCSSVCTVYVDYSTSKAVGGATWSNAVKDIASAMALFTEKAPTGVSCASGPFAGNSSLSWPSNPSSNCPCGYGIRVKNNPNAAEKAFPLSITKNTAIYGGFQATDTDMQCTSSDGPTAPCLHAISERVDPLLKPLGQNAFSQTVFNGPAGGAFEIPGGTTVIIDGFQVKGGTSQILKSGDSCSGTAATSTGPYSAGAITICQGATATLQNLRLVSNSSSISGVNTLERRNGGAIRNWGTFTLKDSMLALNKASSEGGAISHEASSGAASTIERVTFWGNQAGVGGSSVSSGGKYIGGAIASTGGSALNIYASRIQGNFAYGNGGGVYAAANSGTLVVASSLLVDNWVSGGGGGIYNGANSSQFDSLTLIANRAYGSGGGGIYNAATAGVSITNSLFRNNQGLNPSVGTDMAEWGGNRVDFFNQINSISDAMTWSGNSSGSTFNSKAKSSKSYIDMCPIMSYAYDGSGVCDGSQTCGTPTPPTNNGDCSNDQQSNTNHCTFNQQITQGTSNTCSTLEFLDCTGPLYVNCTPNYQKGIAGPWTPRKYSKDILGNPNNGALEGAYQIEGPQSTP